MPCVIYAKVNFQRFLMLIANFITHSDDSPLARRAMFEALVEFFRQSYEPYSLYVANKMGAVNKP